MTEAELQEIKLRSAMLPMGQQECDRFIIEAREDITKLLEHIELLNRVIEQVRS